MYDDVHYMRWILCILVGGMAIRAYAQTSDEIELQFPDQPNWNEVREGESMDFTLTATGGLSGNYTFRLVTTDQRGMELDRQGHFTWTPDFELVTQQEKQKTVPVLFEVSNAGGQITTRQMAFIVHNQTRIPPLENLQPFFVRAEEENHYQLTIAPEFTATAAQHVLPAGMKISSTGEFTWQPTSDQYAQLEKDP